MTETKRSAFGQHSTAMDVVAGIDLRGKRAVVTGASSGIGVETARALASAGAEVILAVRNVEKGEGVARDIRAGTGNDAVRVEALDLTHPASVRDFAGRLGSGSPLHVLVNNAGVMACPLERTAEGFEMQLASNHLGHFLLTCLLAPALRRGAPARVVSLSSRGHRFSPVVFEDLHFERRPYDKWQAYGQSKTANALFAVGLEARLGARGVHANAVHPGAIVTELGRHLSADDIAALQARAPGGKGFQWKSIEAGAATSVWAATTPDLEGKGGLYLEDCHVARPRRSADDEEGYELYALDPEAAERLWRASEEMVGARFDFAA
jgi:NAD(P)-dependent dehydrogenase (short-subunit alcohol dehydrogenase family)